MSSVVNDRLQQKYGAEAIAFDESLQRSFLHSNLAKEEVDILSEKKSTPEMAEKNSGTFNLWGFFLLHLSRYVAITFSIFLYLLANTQRSLGQLYHPADCLPGSSKLVTREHRPLLLAARCVVVAKAPFLFLL